jgi:1-deoxy-D-xylulose-5-phosphate reductoisomerase
MQMITVLGATGSIGVSTLDVVARHPDKYAVFALTAHTQIDKLAEQCEQFSPKFAVVGNAALADQLQTKLRVRGSRTEVIYGVDALCQVSSDAAVDTVMAAIVGAAGLVPTLAAVHAGKKILLANKEALVMAGGLFMQAVADSGSVLLPIDSEHNAIFQCLPADYGRSPGIGMNSGVEKLLLSASGGPFRGMSLEQMHAVTPDQACAHPNWSMGRKISVDSASLMNKGLELIEACWLFAVPEQSIDVVVHPQSIIHSLVQYSDGSVLAQLGNPDMRTPIAHALAWPHRIESGVANLDLFDVARLDFEKPDMQAFPCLGIAREAAQAGANAATILNAANEIAVQAFLDQRIGFTQIASVVAQTLNSQVINEPESLEAVQESDNQARLYSSAYIKSLEK